MNKELSFTVDVSNVGCQCNAVASFLNMPFNNPGGGDYFCDSVGWDSCPEYDLQQGNKYTMEGRLHTCSGETGYWDHCDRAGCGTNVYSIEPMLMCPDDRWAVYPDISLHVLVLV